MKDRSGRIYFLTVGFTLAALVFVVAFTFTTFYRNAASDLDALGRSSLAQGAEQLDGYLIRGMDSVQVTAVAAEYMLRSGASLEELEALLTEESARYAASIDENSTGIYGLFQGTYLDGTHWTPEPGYEPREREWYSAAIEGGGLPVLVSPYVDAQTGKVMMSISQMLYDRDSVISLDITLDGLQAIAQGIHFNGMGYGFVIDKKGLVAAHQDGGEQGKNYLEDERTRGLAEKIYEQRSGSFSCRVDGEDCTVFVDRVMDDWFVAMVISRTRLFQELRTVMIQNALVCLLAFAGIVLFCMVSYRQVRRAARQVEQSSEELRQMNDRITDTLARTIDAKDRYTQGHSRRVAEYAREIARRMGKSEEEQATIYCAGLLHDLGKIRVPEEIINKAGRLTDEEFSLIKLHPVVGFHILKEVFGNSPVTQGAKFHHEQYGGRGYPSGLQGEDIPEIARILGVADAYDAMASNRSYRKALPQEVVREEIEKGKGGQFDPAVADVMLGMMDEDPDYRLKEADEMTKTILVVDDEPINVKTTIFAMKDEPNCTLIGASGGAEALDILKKSPVDLVLLDVKMPGMDGFETLARIRELSQVPVVFMTADKDLGSIERAAALGVDDYLTKPFLPIALREIVHTLLH